MNWKLSKQKYNFEIWIWSWMAPQWKRSWEKYLFRKWFWAQLPTFNQVGRHKQTNLAGYVCELKLHLDKCSTKFIFLKSQCLHTHHHETLNDSSNIWLFWHLILSMKVQYRLSKCSNVSYPSSLLYQRLVCEGRAEHSREITWQTG